ncbi:M81 family metallopeptidase [Muricoccus radiodurans]|uniref:M81 family metallopeptidase n=1 Tax=Muricoccus radiodurans TaxID=2231721 RepID=UPI003CF82DED
MPKIAVARLWFEGNSFTPSPTGRAKFESREWATGKQALSLYAGTATEIGAVGAFLATRPGWDATVLRCASAQPGGPMADEVLAGWLAEVLPPLRTGGFDGVYLSLHGACVAASDPAPDLTIARAVREAVGRKVPVVASFDFHGNMAPEMAELLDGASVYRTYPHVDMDRAASRALDMLERRVGGGAPLHGAIRKQPMVLHSFHMRSAGGPMAEVWAMAAELEEGAVCEAAPFGGFAWSDSPYAGPSGMAWASDAGAAKAAADRIAEAIAARRSRFDVTLPGPEEALRQALAGPAGLVALLDPADNPFSGGIADTPDMLRVLVEQPPPVPVVFAFLHDPDGVQAALAAGEGAVVERALGAQVTGLFGPPVPFRGVVERLTGGRYVNEGPMERGSPVDLGPTCVLRWEPAGGGVLRVIVTSRKEAAVDPAFFALHGIDLGATRLLADKGKNHFRAAFAERCSMIVECDCPGPASLDLAALPFRHVPEGWRIPGG